MQITISLYCLKKENPFILFYIFPNMKAGRQWWRCFSSLSGTHWYSLIFHPGENPANSVITRVTMQTNKQKSQNEVCMPVCIQRLKKVSWCLEFLLTSDQCERRPLHYIHKLFTCIYKENFHLTVLVKFLGWTCDVGTKWEKNIFLVLKAMF